MKKLIFLLLFFNSIFAMENSKEAVPKKDTIINIYNHEAKQEEPKEISNVGAAFNSLKKKKAVITAGLSSAGFIITLIIHLLGGKCN